MTKTELLSEIDQNWPNIWWLASLMGECVSGQSKCLPPLLQQCTLYSLQITECSVQCALYNGHCSLFTVHCAFSMFHCMQGRVPCDWLTVIEMSRSFPKEKISVSMYCFQNSSAQIIIKEVNFSLYIYIILINKSLFKIVQYAIVCRYK